LLIFKLRRHQVAPTSITNNGFDSNIKKRAVSLTSVQGLELLPRGGVNQTEEYFTQLAVAWARRRSINN